jgi:hypothetical protein
VAVKVKSAIKKSKVHRVLKIPTSSESDGNPTPQSDTVMKDVVEQDQNVKATEEETGGPKDNPAPHSEILVEDHKINDEEKQDAPNAEKNGNPIINPEVEAKEVYFTLLSTLHFSYHLLIFTNFYLCL